MVSDGPVVGVVEGLQGMDILMLDASVRGKLIQLCISCL